MRPMFSASILTLTYAFAFSSLTPSLAWADSSKVKTLLARAESHEKAYEWDKAFAAYDDALRIHRDARTIKDRQTAVLRRYWQEQRHKDAGYRKEVLSLEYAQALRLHSNIVDTLIESSLPNTKLTPGQLFKKGVEELETALCDPGFLANYLTPSRPSAIIAFREFLNSKKNESFRWNRRDCGRAVREVALAAQSSLDLSPTVALMELACGACYAIDEYTSYLTPTQFRELNDSLKTGFVASVEYSLKSMDVGYIRITQFQESTPHEVDDAIAALGKNGVKALVLDLRGNPGGLIESSVEVARRFLTNGIIASMENYDPKLSTVYHSRNPAAWTSPLVALIDQGTASAAEVLVGALKDNGRARVLGQPSYGKGSSQGVVRLPDALGGLPTGGLRLTIARFYSPKGLPYAGQGVVPDLLLDPAMADEMDISDPQILAAVDDLRRTLSLVDLPR